MIAKSTLNPITTALEIAWVIRSLGSSAGDSAAHYLRRS